MEFLQEQLRSLDIVLDYFRPWKNEVQFSFDHQTDEAGYLGSDEAFRRKQIRHIIGAHWIRVLDDVVPKAEICHRVYITFRSAQSQKLTEDLELASHKKQSLRFISRPVT